MSEKFKMSMWEHVGELRKRLVYIFLLFAVSMVVGFIFAEDVIQYLKNQPTASQIDMAVFGITDAFKVYFQFSLVLGIVITFPFALFQIWAFVKPGLTPKERRVTLSYIPGAAFLFLIGLSFGYYWLFPFAMEFMTGIATKLGGVEMYGMLQYFSFLFTLVVPFGVLFQLPLLILFLTRLEIITPQLLKNIRKYAYFALFVIAAIITPPEILSHLFVTLPLILLYEVSIWMSNLTYQKKRKQKENEIEVVNQDE